MAPPKPCTIPHILLAAMIGALAGGAIALLLSRAIPRMISKMTGRTKRPPTAERAISAMARWQTLQPRKRPAPP